MHSRDSTPRHRLENFFCVKLDFEHTKCVCSFSSLCCRRGICREEDEGSEDGAGLIAALFLDHSENKSSACHPRRRIFSRTPNPS